MLLAVTTWTECSDAASDTQSVEPVDARMQPLSLATAPQLNMCAVTAAWVMLLCHTMWSQLHRPACQHEYTLLCAACCACYACSAEIATAVTAANPRPVTLKMEKVYYPCILQTKKRYVGFAYESPDQAVPVFDAKGIETVRWVGAELEGVVCNTVGLFKQCPALSISIHLCIPLSICV